jgi:hypothetical protein
MQRKLTLRLEDLTVDSFRTSPGEPAKGTVIGEQCTCPTACTCPGCYTCDATCPATCYNTCDDYTCAESCDGACPVYSDECNSYAPCPTPAYTNCGRYLCN